MPPRIGAHGAIVKPRSSTNPQRRAIPTASKVIDLTLESSGESPGETSRETSPEEEEAEDTPERHRERSDKGRRDANSSASTHTTISRAGRGTTGQARLNDRQQIARYGQEDVLEDSYVVTSLHHRPWGAGDDNTTVGVFASEEEATTAAEKAFNKQVGADGWEVDWHRCAGDGMLQLRGIIEEGEDDSERYTASIKLIQRKRPVVVQQRVQSAAQPKPRLVKPRFVYVVKEEQRMNVGEDDPQGFYNELGSLKAVEIHGIYMELNAANEHTREIYDGILEDLGDGAETFTDTLESSRATILVENREEMMTYLLTVEKRSLR